MSNEKSSQKREYLNNNLLGTRQVLLQGEDIRQLLESLQIKCNIFTKIQKHDKMYKQENEGIFFHLNLA